MRLKLLVIASIILITACSHFEHHHDNSANHDAHSSHATGEVPLKLKLNGNDKWLMDAHTRSVTADMVDRFTSIEVENQNQEDLTKLGEQLSQDLDKLIQGCTMKGDAHNSLHDFLGSFMPALEQLKTTGTVDSAKHVEHLLTEYQHYFE